MLHTFQPEHAAEIRLCSAHSFGARALHWRGSSSLKSRLYLLRLQVLISFVILGRQPDRGRRCITHIAKLTVEQTSKMRQKEWLRQSSPLRSGPGYIELHEGRASENPGLHRIDQSVIYSATTPCLGILARDGSILQSSRGHGCSASSGGPKQATP